MLLPCHYIDIPEEMELTKWLHTTTHNNKQTNNYVYILLLGKSKNVDLRGKYSDVIISFPTSVL